MTGNPTNPIETHGDERDRVGNKKGMSDTPNKHLHILAPSRNPPKLVCEKDI